MKLRPLEKYGMITAAKALEVSKEFTDESYKEEVLAIMKTIQERAYRGFTHVHLIQLSNLKYKTAEILEELGYKVNYSKQPQQNISTKPKYDIVINWDRVVCGAEMPDVGKILSELGE